MGRKCNRDCFNCVHTDCIVDGITAEERQEIKERDLHNMIGALPKCVANQRPTRAKHRHNH